MARDKKKDADSESEELDTEVDEIEEEGEEDLDGLDDNEASDHDEDLDEEETTEESAKAATGPTDSRAVAYGRSAAQFTTSSVAGASKMISTLRQTKDPSKRLRARKVRRVIRHIDPWSVLTFSAIFHLVVFGALFIAILLILVIASWFNLLDSFEALIREFSSSYETFEIKLFPLAQSLAILGFILVLFGTMLHVLGAVLFNLISDLVGGIRVTVVEEDVVAVENIAYAADSEDSEDSEESEESDESSDSDESSSPIR